MKTRQIPRVITALRLCVYSLLVAAFSNFIAWADPAWWIQQRAVSGGNPQDFAAANQGQLKNMARAAMADLDARVVPVPNTPLAQKMAAARNLVASWPRGTGRQGNTSDYSMVTVGQVKAVAKRFWDILQDPDIALATGYPWSGVNARDFSAANIGQIKHAFAFDITQAQNYPANLYVFGPSVLSLPPGGTVLDIYYTFFALPADTTLAWTATPAAGAAIATPADASTDITFSAPGIYTILCTATNGIFRNSAGAMVQVVSNVAPVVQISPDTQSIQFGETLTVSGVTVTDTDGFNIPPALLWFGAFGVNYDDDQILNPTVSFDYPGVFVLTLQADDGLLNTTADLTVTVAGLDKFSVYAGNNTDVCTNQAMPLAGSYALIGTPIAPVSVQWTKVSGPGDPVFGDPSSPTTLVMFPQPGTYELQLDVSCNGVEAMDNVSIVVYSIDVDAGLDQSVSDFQATLAGVINTTPNDFPQATWSVVSKPPNSSVTFANRFALNTTATFSTGGQYVLQLTGAVGFAPVCSASDTVTITVASINSGVTGLIGKGCQGNYLLQWDQYPVPAGFTFVRYNIYRRDPGAADFHLVQISSPVSSTSVHDNTALAGSTYEYYVRCALRSSTNVNVETPDSNHLTVTIKLICPPDTIKVAGANTEAYITWKRVAGAATYRVKRSTVSGGPYTQIPLLALYDNPNSDFLGSVDIGLVNGQSYYYVVSAVNSSNAESDNSDEAKADVKDSALRPGFYQNYVLANDDEASGLVDLGFIIKIKEAVNASATTSHSAVYVNNNGKLTFYGHDVQTQDNYTPYYPFNNIYWASDYHRVMIAPFFADVDSRESPSPVRYSTGSVGGAAAFGAEWITVGYYNNHYTEVNTFQVVLIDRHVGNGIGDFDIEFDYDQIEWNTGDASHGDNGLADYSARAGFRFFPDTYSVGNPVGVGSYEVPGSGIPGRLLDTGVNSLKAGGYGSGVAGRFLFKVRNGVVVQ